MITFLARYRKAIIAFLGAGAGPIIAGYVGDNVLTADEIWTAIVAAFATLGITVIAPNRLSVSDLRTQPNLSLITNAQYGKQSNT